MYKLPILLQIDSQMTPERSLKSSKYPRSQKAANSFPINPGPVPASLCPQSKPLDILDHFICPHPVCYHHPHPFISSHVRRKQTLVPAAWGIIAFPSSPKRLCTMPPQPLSPTQQTKVAPPVSIASISKRSIGCLRKRAGSSLRSKNSPLAGATEPRECPD